MATKKYKCKVCGYIHEGKTAPESCPVCKAPASEFDEMKEKRSFNKENGAYIFVYTSVIIVIVIHFWRSQKPSSSKHGT